MSVEQDTEAARWQARIEQIITSHGLTPCDPSGNESGDPLDWTDGQVTHALHDAHAKGALEFARAILHGDEKHRAWLLRAAEEFAEDGQPSAPVAESEDERLRIVLSLIQTICRIQADLRELKGQPPVKTFERIQEIVQLTLDGAPL